jgi:alpha-1,3/alpha-1,6-mannosyltransferase
VYAIYSCAHLLGFWAYFGLGHWLVSVAPNTSEWHAAHSSSTQRQAQAPSLRIAFIHPDLGIGGAERLVVDAAVGLQSAGHHVHVYTAHHDPGHCFEETRDGTLTVTVFGDWLPRGICGRCMALAAYVRVFWVSARVLWRGFWSEDLRYDCLVVDQVSHAVPMLTLLSGAHVVFYCHYPDYLLTQRASLAKQLYRAPLDLAEELTTGCADVVLVNSKFTASTFARAFPTLARCGLQPAVLYPAINLQLQEVPAGAESESDAPSLSFDGARHVLLSINRFERKKNIALALRAVGALPPSLRRPGELALVLAGGYDTRVRENVEVYSELEVLAEELGLTELLHMMPNISMATKARLLRRADCLLYTPDKEHFGIVPVEAMYAECPVLAVDSGGPLESIAEGSVRPCAAPDPVLVARVAAI